MLRHLVDSLAWKAFDDRYLDFISNIHNVRLGLGGDVFNPFQTFEFYLQRLVNCFDSL